MVSLEFFVDYGLGVESTFNRNKEVTHLRVSNVSKSGNLNILEPGGPVIGL
jgi:hypothetical protein